jgi:hypothetical protein
MRARPRLGRFRKLNLYARSMGLVRPRVDVIQLPHVPGERWLGLPFNTEPEEGRAALLLLNHSWAYLDSAEACTGLLLDDWTEVIPHKLEDTGIAFHYQSAQAQAPQAVLVAAPSRADTHWSFDELLAWDMHVHLLMSSAASAGLSVERAEQRIRPDMPVVLCSGFSTGQENTEHVQPLEIFCLAVKSSWASAFREL